VDVNTPKVDVEGSEINLNPQTIGLAGLAGGAAVAGGATLQGGVPTTSVEAEGSSITVETEIIEKNPEPEQPHTDYMLPPKEEKAATVTTTTTVIQKPKQYVEPVEVEAETVEV
jgi:hypothetical protein